MSCFPEVSNTQPYRVNACTIASIKSVIHILTSNFLSCNGWSNSLEKPFHNTRSFILASLSFTYFHHISSLQDAQY